MKTNMKITAAAMALTMLLSSAPAVFAKSDYNLRATNKKENSFVLSWDANAEADAYRIYKYDPETDSFVVYKSVKNEKVTISELQPDTKYKLKVYSLQMVDGKYQVISKSGIVTVKTAASAPAVSETPTPTVTKTKDHKDMTIAELLKADNLTAEDLQRVEKEYNTAVSNRKKLENNVKSLNTTIENLQKKIDKGGLGNGASSADSAKNRQEMEEKKKELQRVQDELSEAIRYENKLKSKLIINGVQVTS